MDGNALFGDGIGVTILVYTQEGGFVAADINYESSSLFFRFG